MGKDSFYCRYIKGTIDTIIAAAGILLFWWVYVLIAIAIKIEDPKGPVIFAQERLGKDGKVYLMYKFRSMKVGAEHTGSGVYSDDKDERVTKVGRMLRSTSLDELPQLWNVLKGESSMIGFRSPLTYHPWTWDEYTEELQKAVRKALVYLCMRIEKSKDREYEKTPGYVQLGVDFTPHMPDEEMLAYIKKFLDM